MAHLTSSAALHTARVILKNFDLTVRPPESLTSGRIDVLEANEKCVAVLTDYATNVFELAVLRPEIRYWQRALKARTASAPQIAAFFQKMLSTFEKIPQDTFGEAQMVTTFETPKTLGNKVVPRGFGERPQVHVLSKPAREVSRFIFHYYFVKPKTGTADDKLDRHKVAHLAEVSLGLSRTMEILPWLRETNRDLKEGKATEREIRKCMREVGVHFQYLPTYEERDEEVRILY